MKNQEEINNENNENYKNVKQNNSEEANFDAVEKDLERIGGFIKIIIIVVIVVAIGVFAWFIGKDLFRAIGLIDSGMEEIDRDSYTSIIEDVTGKDL